jgi:hypothetical protein
MRRLFLLAAVTLALTTGTAGAVLGGQPDGSNHPYVGLATDGVFACSGTLLSPTVFLTAAHCFSDDQTLLGHDSATGAPIVRVSFDPDLAKTPAAQRVWNYGSFYFDRRFAPSPGEEPTFDTHDVALIIFGSPGCRVPSGVTGIGSCAAVAATSFGALPRLNLIDTFSRKTAVDIVGYGAQDFVKVKGQGKQPADANTRVVGQTTLVNRDKFGGDFVKIKSNDAAPCFGDSGGPDLLGGTNVVLAITSFGKNSRCTGASFSYRADTAEAQSWIAGTVSAKGGSLAH